MAGIFGYFSQEIDENRLNEIVNAIKAENYSITNQILNRSCFLSKLDLISSEVKASITEKAPFGCKSIVAKAKQWMVPIR